MRTIENHSIVIIDDECILCNRLVRNLVAADKNDKFRIAGLKSNAGIRIINDFGKINQSSNTLFLVEQGNIFEASEAVWRIAISLRRYYWLGKLIKLLPRKLRDRIYYLIAKRRILFFGKSTECKWDDSIIRKTIYEVPLR